MSKEQPDIAIINSNELATIDSKFGTPRIGKNLSEPHERFGHHIIMNFAAGGGHFRSPEAAYHGAGADFVNFADKIGGVHIAGGLSGDNEYPWFFHPALIPRFV